MFVVDERTRMTSKKATRATVADLLSKTARTKEITISTGNGSDLTMLFRSIGAKAYDDLVGEHKPTKEQAKEGGTWNPETFPPALISACSKDPQISHEEAIALWESEDWSRGELMDVFVAVVKLNSEGLDIPFNGSA